MDRTDRITKFGLSNFKSFHYLEDIELRPLTVLVGTNSVGKSSLLQSLLLLKQTLEADRYNGVLKFDGEWTHLGSYANIVSNFDTSRMLEYRFAVQQQWFHGSAAAVRDTLRLVFPEIKFSKKQLREATQLQSLWLASDLLVRFVQKAGEKHTLVDEFTITSRMPDLMTNNQATTISMLNNGCDISTKNINLASFMMNATSKLNGVEFDKLWPKNLKMEAQMNPSNGREKEVLVDPVAYSMPIRALSSIGYPLEFLRKQLSDQLEYLGPLRADPRPFYPVEETPDIGPRGEATVPYLLRHQNDTVRYVPSPMHSVLEATLLDATNYWLKAMKVTDCLSINPIEAIAYVASIQSRSASTKSVNLSQVGFGVGQLLPVLVTGLKGPNDSTLLLEQPEIHLHPRLQAMLAEFLLCTAQGGKTVIVETHSDHMINRLRRRIAEDETGKLAELVSILFVHPGTEDNPGSYVEELKIDAMGNIINWPPDFLSEAADESLAILRASQQKTLAARP